MLGIGHPGLACAQFGLGILQILVQTAFFGSQIPFLNTAFLQLFLPTLQLMPGPFHGGHPVILLELLNLFRFAGLVLQLLHGTVDLKKNILNPRQVGFGILQTSHGFFLADFVFGDPGGLFKQITAGMILVVEDLVNHLELDNGIGITANTGIQKEIGDVFEAASDPVQKVFTFSRTVQAASDGHLAVLGGQDALVVIKSQPDLGQSGLFAVVGTVKNHPIHLVGTEHTGFLFAQYPSNGVHDIGLTAPIGSDNTGDPFLESHQDPIPKTLKTLDLNFRKSHIFSIV